MSAPPRPTQAQLRAAKAATWGGAPPSRPAMRLSGWRPLARNSLRGFGDIELPSGLRIREVAVLSSNRQCWATLPSKPVLDRNGRHVETNGKKQFAAILEWRSRELADGFSAKIIELVHQVHPGALEQWRHDGAECGMPTIKIARRP